MDRISSVNEINKERKWKTDVKHGEIIKRRTGT